jgi:hypothetical protein
MDQILDPITGFLDSVNYVYIVEILVILSIILVLVYIFHSLGIFRKEK